MTPKQRNVRWHRGEVFLKGPLAQISCNPLPVGAIKSRSMML